MNDLAELTIDEQDALVIARITGELDVSMAPRMGEEIAVAVPTSARGLVVDFSELEFIDSSGVAMLFTLVRKLSSRRQDLFVVAPKNEPVTRVLEIVDFDKAAPVHEDLNTALAAAS
jgi:anti-sigma B factor antagonist